MKTLYRWRVRMRCPERFGELCYVLVRGRMNSCLVEFLDGYRIVTSRNYLRRSVETQAVAKEYIDDET